MDLVKAKNNITKIVNSQYVKHASGFENIIGKNLENADLFDIKKWYDSIDGANNTINTKLYALSSIFKKLHALEIIKKNVFKQALDLGIVKTKQVVKHVEVPSM